MKDKYYCGKYYCGKCKHIGIYTGRCAHSEKICKLYAEILKVDDNGVEKCVPCVCKTLETENAALRERLEKAVELPVKLGDPVYYLQYFCDYKGCDSTTQQFCCGCKEMIEREKSKEYYVIREKPFELKDLPKIGKKYFTTREAAEARLAELKGGDK